MLFLCFAWVIFFLFLPGLIFLFFAWVTFHWSNMVLTDVHLIFFPRWLRQKEPSVISISLHRPLLHGLMNGEIIGKIAPSIALSVSLPEGFWWCSTPGIPVVLLTSFSSTLANKPKYYVNTAAQLAQQSPCSVQKHCLCISMWVKCWLPRGQQVSHQRWIWGIHSSQVMTCKRGDSPWVWNPRHLSTKV